MALRLFQRLGFSTDNTPEWETLPDPLTIHRAGEHQGVCWTTERHVAEFLADGAPIRTAHVRKTDVLAYITERGESEIVLHPTIATKLHTTT